MCTEDPDETSLEELERINEALAEYEASPAQPQNLRETLLAVERREFIAALKRANGVGVEAVRLLGISRGKYNRRMDILGLVAKDWRRRPC